MWTFTIPRTFNKQVSILASQYIYLVKVSGVEVHVASIEVRQGICSILFYGCLVILHSVYSISHKL